MNTKTYQTYLSTLAVLALILAAIFANSCTDQSTSFHEIAEAPEIINPADGDIITTQQPTFAWKGQQGTAEYQFYVNNTLVYKGMDTQFQVTDEQKLPMTIQPYTCQVKAKNEFQIFESEIHSFRIIDGETPLVNIEMPKSGTSIAGLVRIEGTAVDNVAVNYIEIQVNDEDWKRVDMITPVQDYKVCDYAYEIDANYLDPGVHNVTVKAYDEGGKVSTPFQIQVLIPDPEQVPQLEGPISNACTKLPTFHWSEISGAEDYEFQIATDPDYENVVVRQRNITNRELRLKEPLEDGTYHWRVRARKQEEQYTLWSVSNELDVDDVPQPVRISPAGDSVSLTAAPAFEWTEVRGTKAYTLLVSNDCSFENVIYSKVIPAEEVQLNAKGHVHFRIHDTLYNGAYCWKVIADTGKCLVGTDIPYPWTINALGGVGGHWPWCGKLICGNCILWWAPPEDGLAVAYDIQLDDNSDFSSPIIDEQISSVSWSTSQAGALDQGWYYFRVRAVDADGNVSIWRYCWYHLVQIEDAPETVTPIHEETTCNPVFSWNSIQYATHYHLMVATDSDFDMGDMVIQKELTELSYEPSVTELPDGEYYWQVNAFRYTEDGELECEGPYSEPQKVNVAGRIQKTTAENPYYCSSVTDPTPLFEWIAQDNVSGYRIQVRADGGTYNTPVMERLVLGAVGNYTSDYAIPNGYYYWRIQGYSEACADGEWSDERFFVIGCVDAPALLTPANNEDACNLFPTFTWEALNFDMGDPSYILSISLDSGFTNLVGEYVLDNNFYVPSPALANNATYYWKVKARVDVGGGCTIEKESAVRSFYIDAPTFPTPTPIAPISGGQVCSTTPTLLFSNALDNGTYSVEIGISPTFEDGTIRYVEHELNTAFPIPADKPLSNKTMYYWRMYSSDGTCVGLPGPAYSFVVTELTAPALSAPANGQHITAGDFTFIWQDLATAETYELTLSTSPDFATTQVKSNITNNGISLSATGFSLVPDTRYYWRVRAFNNMHSGNCVGPYSLGGYFDYK